MVPRDLNIGFQGLALIQGQIYNPVVNWAEWRAMFLWTKKNGEFGVPTVDN